MLAQHTVQLLRVKAKSFVQCLSCTTYRRDLVAARLSPNAAGCWLRATIHVHDLDYPGNLSALVLSRRAQAPLLEKACQHAVALVAALGGRSAFCYLNVEDVLHWHHAVGSSSLHATEVSSYLLIPWSGKPCLMLQSLVVILQNDQQLPDADSQFSPASLRKW